MKFVVYNKLFSDEWGLLATLNGQMLFIRRLAKFINEKYPNINSFKELDLEKSNIQWIDWLNNNNIKTITRDNVDSKLRGKEILIKTSSANFLEDIIKWLTQLTGEREEWEKINGMLEIYNSME